MKKIASPKELQAELLSLMAFIHNSEKPDRRVLASKLNELADRVEGRSKTAIDQVAKRELELYMDNESRLYNQKMSIIKNIQRKMKSGRYDSTRAPKLWMYWVDAGAKMYVKEFGGPGDSVRYMFPKPLREALAKELAVEYEEAIKNGEYD